MSHTLVLKPRLNEKTYGLAASGVYVFEVDRVVNKHSIARAVEAQFEVTVTAVNTTNIPGKAKRVLSLTGRRARNTEGVRSDFKKAYVTLADGQALPFFDAIEEEEQKEQATQEKIDKAAAKQAAKEEKAAAKTDKTDKVTEAKAEKPAAKPADTTAAAPKKPAATPEAAAAEPEKPAEAKKFHIPAWRGFRLRKKNKGEDK